MKPGYLSRFFRRLCSCFSHDTHFSLSQLFFPPISTFAMLWNPFWKKMFTNHKKHLGFNYDASIPAWFTYHGKLGRDILMIRCVFAGHVIKENRKEYLSQKLSRIVKRRKKKTIQSRALTNEMRLVKNHEKRDDDFCGRWTKGRGKVRNMFLFQLINNKCNVAERWYDNLNDDS